MGKIRIILADDHPVFRRGLSMLLQNESDDVEIIASFANGRDIIDFLEKNTTDVLLLDARMPELDGVETVRILKSKQPDIKTIILTTFGDAETIRTCLACGVDGFILKDAPVSDILDAIRQVTTGKKYISDQTLKTLSQPPDDKNRSHQAQMMVNALTIRQQEVLQLIAQGKRNNDIADTLCISERTVRNYVSQIYEIIGVNTRGEAIVWAREHNIV